MKILAMDTSSIVASVAVIENDVLISEYTINYKKTHSQTLMPMIETMNNAINLDLDTLDAIAVASGPGSFTGLRIGAATAKGMAMALNIPIISVPTLDALAYNIIDSTHVICPMMDARRNQVYTALYEYNNEELVSIIEQTAIPIENLVEQINQLNRPVTLLGDGIDIYKPYLIENLKCPFSFAKSHINRQRAGAVGALAINYAKKGYLMSAEKFVPNYIRKSQAEREYEERESIYK